MRALLLAVCLVLPGCAGEHASSRREPHTCKGKLINVGVLEGESASDLATALDDAVPEMECRAEVRAEVRTVLCYAGNQRCGFDSPDGVATAHEAVRVELESLRGSTEGWDTTRLACACRLYHS